MKTVIVTNHTLKFHSGSEMITLDLLDYFANKAEYEVYLCANEIAAPLSKYINPKVKQINLSKVKQFPVSKADIVIGHHRNVIDKVLETVQCSTVIQNSLSPYPGIESYSDKATRLFANSQETKEYKQNKVTLPIEVFVNSCNDTYFHQTKQLNSSIKRIAVISNHSWHKGMPHRAGVSLDVIGGYRSKFVNVQLLLQYDVVITIGRTVQQCLCLGVPVYCYDHFGGPGYITTANIDFNEYFNFSGRQNLNDFTEVKVHNYNKIFNDIYSQYAEMCKQQQELIAIARQRYNFNKKLDKVLKKELNHE